MSEGRKERNREGWREKMKGGLVYTLRKKGFQKGSATVPI